MGNQAQEIVTADEMDEAMWELWIELRMIQARCIHFGMRVEFPTKEF